MKSSKNKIFYTNYQKIIKFLASNPSDELTEREIQDAVHISRASANFVLRELVKDGLVNVQKRGKTAFYVVDFENPLVRQIKVLINLIKIEPLVKHVSEISDKIILFGSSAVGTNIEESDIDLFILANQPNKVLEIINKGPLSEKIQAVIKKPADFLTLKKKDPIFYEEVSRGLLIWEKK